MSVWFGNTAKDWLTGEEWTKIGMNVLKKTNNTLIT